MAKSDTTQTFEQLMSRIEELTETLEDPQTGIEQSLGHYEEAMKLVGEAQKRLTDIEHKFEEIQRGSQQSTKTDSPSVSEQDTNTTGVSNKHGGDEDGHNAQKTLL